MKLLSVILSFFFTINLLAGGDYLITSEGEKIEVKRLQVRKNKFHVRLQDRTMKVYSSKEIASYYNAEEDEYFEKLTVKEKTHFCKVILTDGIHKIIVFEEKMEYGGGQIAFETMYYFEGKECKSVFTKKNHYHILSTHFTTCPSFHSYVLSKKRWFGKLKKLDAYLKSKCQGRV